MLFIISSPDCIHIMLLLSRIFSCFFKESGDFFFVILAKIFEI